MSLHTISLDHTSRPLMRYWLEPAKEVGSSTRNASYGKTLQVENLAHQEAGWYTAFLPSVQVCILVGSSLRGGGTEK